MYSVTLIIIIIIIIITPHSQDKNHIPIAALFRHVLSHKPIYYIKICTQIIFGTRSLNFLYR